MIGPVLVTGASGFVGRALVERLLREGTAVRAAVRGAGAALPAGCERVVVGNLGRDNDWRGAVGGASAVVHCAARVHVVRDESIDPLTAFREANRDGSTALAHQAAEAGVRRFVFVSTIGVNGAETFGRPFTAADKPAPHSPYAVAKHEAEVGLRAIGADTKMGIVIVRPPLVYGAGAPGNFRTLMRALRSGWPLPLGAIENRRSFIAIDNLIDLLSVSLRHDAAPGLTMLASDGEDLSTTEFLRRTARAMGTRARLVPLPMAWLRKATALAGRPELGQRLCGSLETNIEPTWTALGWRPPVAVDEALARAVRHT